MLLGNFFTVEKKVASGNTIVVTINLNGRHPIFDGHFPGRPVVPGVCMMQIIQELAAIELQKKIQLRKADQVKFLAVINPVEHPTIVAEFSYVNNETDDIHVNGRLYKNEVTFLKFKGSFVVQKTTGTPGI